jgi:hypothetical protein
MRTTRLTLLTAGVTAGVLLSLGAAQPARAGVDLGDILGNFDITIGDTGSYYDGWDDGDSRVYSLISDGYGHEHAHYFSDLASAFYVLRENYGSAKILELRVPEFRGGDSWGYGNTYGPGWDDSAYYDDGVYGGRDTSAAVKSSSATKSASGAVKSASDIDVDIYVDSGRDGRGGYDYGRRGRERLIDGLHAYYVFDNRTGPGGLPVILAFNDYRDAEGYGRRYGGRAYGFRDMASQLNDWCRSRERNIYWRGSDPNCDAHTWRNAWSQRWEGYGWDNNNGWTLQFSYSDRDDHRGYQDNYRNSRIHPDVRGPHPSDDGYRRGRGRGRGRH